MSAPLQIRAVGDAALTVELGTGIDAAVNARVRALDARLRERPFPGLVETVPSYAALLLCFDPAACAPEEAAARVRAQTPDLDAATAPNLREHLIPTRYDGADLDAVARECGLSAAEVVRRHGATPYTAFFLGFMPGFAYLGPLDPVLHTRRRATPRTRVPAGSVAVAGAQTAIYPGASPGGWNLIGRTGLTLFDARAHPPARIAPGDRVRFVPTDAGLDPLPPAAANPTPERPAVEVIEPGLLTSVQDRGRIGYRRVGVPTAGAADRDALARANRAVGNDDGAAALEITATGPTLRFLAPVVFALTGADLGAMLERSDLGAWPVPRGHAVRARAGNVLRCGARVSGLRAYLALAGGVDVPLVLGSRATDLVGGFGGYAGRALRAGDVIGHGNVPTRDLGETMAEPALADEVTARIVWGPQDDLFSEETRAALVSSVYGLDALSDRIGCRLQGGTLTAIGPGEITTDGMVPGCIQVPPSGQPVVMLADAPTTGGYPKIATVVSEDLPLLAQLVPGHGRVRFTPLA